MGKDVPQKRAKVIQIDKDHIQQSDTPAATVEFGFIHR